MELEHPRFGQFRKRALEAAALTLDVKLLVLGRAADHVAYPQVRFPWNSGPRFRSRPAI